MLLGRNHVSIREVAQVLGLLVSSLPVVQYGPLFCRNIEIDKNEALHKNKGNFEALMQLSPESREDLSWWVRTLPQGYKQIYVSNSYTEVTTDASKIGWEGGGGGCLPWGDNSRLVVRIRKIEAHK